MIDMAVTDLPDRTRRPHPAVRRVTSNEIPSTAARRPPRSRSTSGGLRRQKWFGHRSLLRSIVCVGSRASRNPSPRKLIASTVDTSAQPRTPSPTRTAHGLAPTLGDHATPRRDRWPNAEAEERQRSLDDDRVPTISVVCTMIGLMAFGKDVPEDDAAVARTSSPSRLDELLLAKRQELGPHDAAEPPHDRKPSRRAIPSGPVRNHSGGTPSRAGCARPRWRPAAAADRARGR